MKRYFWGINLGLLAVLGLLSAQVVNNLLAEQIVSLSAGPEKAKPKTRRVTEAVANADEWADLVSDRNLFNSEPPLPEDPTPKDTSELDAEPLPPDVIDPDMIPLPGEECPKSDAAVKLLATMAAEPPEWSLAAITEHSLQRIIRIGQKVDERKLVAVQRSRIVFFKQGVFECVEVGDRPGRGSVRASRAKKSRTPKAKKPSASKTDKYKDGIKSMGKNRYEIDRGFLNEQLDDLGALTRQARVIPHYRQGKPKGFKMVGVRPNSLYTHLGLRSGDILKSVNGEEISSPTKALELYEKLKTSDSVTLEVERRGRQNTFEYNIK